MISSKDNEIGLVCDYLSLAFPQVRIRPNKSKKFSRAVIIPPGYTSIESNTYIFDTYEETLLLTSELKKILLRVFAFDGDVIIEALVKYFDLT
jgi:hypothetical protein